MADTPGRPAGSHFAPSGSQGAANQMPPASRMRPTPLAGAHAAWQDSSQANPAPYQRASQQAVPAHRASHAAPQAAGASQAHGRHAAAAAPAQQVPAAVAGQGAPNAAQPARRHVRHAASQGAGYVAGGNAASGMQSLATPRTRDERAQARRGGHSRKAPLIALGIATAVIVVVLAGVILVPRFLKSEPTQAELANQGQQVEVVIDDGSGALSIAAKLKEAGVIASSDEFVTEVQKQKAESSLKSGAYFFTIGSSYDDIISQLTKGPNSTSGRLTIPEGLTLTQTAAAVEQTLSISSDDFLAQAKASNYASEYGFLADASDDSLEGFLCPKTYDFSGQSGLTADTVIRAMLDQYAADVASLDFAGAEATIQQTYGVTMSDYDILKLASIVEREAITAAQRPKVSSTFYNRLKIGMALQSDATMGYVTGGEVTASDLKTESPYNTYLNTGLTPTPICSPSLESIQATLSPDDTDYLYFFITQDNEYFSATYDEHLQAVEENR